MILFSGSITPEIDVEAKIAGVQIIDKGAGILTVMEKIDIIFAEKAQKTRSDSR